VLISIRGEESSPEINRQGPCLLEALEYIRQAKWLYLLHMKLCA